MQEPRKNHLGKYPECVPLVHCPEQTDTFYFDSDVSAFDKDRSDLENKNQRSWNLNVDLAVKKQAGIFFKPSYEIMPKIVSESMATFQGFTLLPLKELKLHLGENQLRIIDKTNKDIERCSSCKAYLSPYVTLTHREKNWICACCGCTNSLYAEYFDIMDGSFDAEKQRVELTNEVFEYYVPASYTGFYDRQKDKLIFVIDVSRKALIEGE